MEFYLTLLEIMKEKNLSTNEVSKLTGLSYSTVDSIIKRKSKKIALEVAFKLSKGLSVSLERLNGEAERPVDFNVERFTSLPETVKKIVDSFNELNDEGQKKLQEHADVLVASRLYARGKKTDSEEFGEFSQELA